MRKKHKSTLNKEKFFNALEKNLGIVTLAAKECGINKASHYLWLKTDENYREKVEALKDAALDFAEGQLFKRMQEKDTSAIIFYLKTQGKGRGYAQEGDRFTSKQVNEVKLTIEEIN